MGIEMFRLRDALGRESWTERPVPTVPVEEPADSPEDMLEYTRR